ncbi:MAG: ABC-2 family transporter protein [Clostridiales bacterium]|jgi:ABC-2 type transport system permease protein|nr:ABC-2 family transporter protein [Clostridiales bacterium]
MRRSLKFRPLLKACFSLFRIETAESLQYRAAAIAGASIGIFWGLIEITVYTVFFLFADRNEAALSLPQVVSYCWLHQCLFGFFSMNIDSEILAKINNGDVGVELCRPLDLYFHWFSKTAGKRIGRFWWRGIITAAVALLMPAGYRLGAPDSSWVPGFCLFLISIGAAFLLCTSFGMLITAIRMGITWGEGPANMLFLLSLVLSGAYLPLQLWPDAWQGFLFFQPFAGNFDLPIRMYVGSLSPGGGAAAIGIQLTWTAVFIASGRVIMKRKLRNIIVQGG